IPSYTNGKIFAGWYTTAECTDGTEFTAETISENTTIYCKWDTPFVMAGTYKGFNLYNTTSGTKTLSSISNVTTIGNDGSYSGYQLTAGTLDAQYKDVIDGVIMMGKYVYYNQEMGILWYAYGQSNTSVNTDTAFMIKADGVSSFDYSGKKIDNIYAAWITVNYTDGTSKNAFLYNSKVYANVTWTDGITAKSAKDNDLSVYASDGTPLAQKSGDTILLPDGMGGTYTGTLPGTTGTSTIVIDGVGGVLLNDESGTYELENGTVTIKTSTRKVIVSVNKATGSFQAIEDGYQGTYTLPSGETVVLDGFGNVGEATYVVSGTQIVFYNADGTIEYYGIDVNNKVLLGMSAFGGKKYVANKSSYYYFEFNKESSISGKLTLKSNRWGVSSDPYVTFTGVLEGNTLTLTITEVHGLENCSVGSKIVLTVGENTLTVTKDPFWGDYYDDYVSADISGWVFTCA
ncbi:MAG: hypothetical protein ACI4QH_04730, partial [Candidatus Fimimonas sp.]